MEFILLTFERLTDRLSCDAILGPVYDKLDTAGSYFENHYLRRPGTDSITGPSDWAQLSRYTTLFHVNADGDSKNRFIDFVPKQELHYVESDQFFESFQRCSSRFAWVHCDSLNDIDNLIDGCRNRVQHNGAMLFVTSIFGNQCDLPEPLESLLPESEIRVPLWVISEPEVSRRVHGISGSEMITQTIACRLQNEDAKKNDLVRMRDSHFEQDSIRVDTDRATALRSEDFLLVKSTIDERRALYAKPEDVWNCHDVSAEYPDLVETLLQRF